LCLSFSPSEDNGVSEAVVAMELCVKDIKKWMTRGKLLMNDDKTEVLVRDSRQQLAKVDIDRNTISNAANISPYYVLGLIGFYP